MLDRRDAAVHSRRCILDRPDAAVHSRRCVFVGSNRTRFLTVPAQRPPNALRVSRAAPLDREGSRAESRFQNASDLAAAQRRRLHALVGPQSALGLQNALYDDVDFGDAFAELRFAFFVGIN